MIVKSGDITQNAGDYTMNRDDVTTTRTPGDISELE